MKDEKKKTIGNELRFTMNDMVEAMRKSRNEAFDESVKVETPREDGCLNWSKDTLKGYALGWNACKLAITALKTKG